MARTYDAKSADDIEPHIVSETKKSADGAIVGTVDWRYEFHEMSLVGMEIESQEPNENQPATIQQREVNIVVSGQAKELLTLSRDAITLRRYGVHEISLSLQASNRLSGLDGEVSLITKRPAEDAIFAVGPEFHMKFHAKKSPERAKWAIVAGLIGVVAALVATVTSIELGYRILAVIIAFFAPLYAGLLWSGTISFLPGKR